MTHTHAFCGDPYGLIGGGVFYESNLDSCSLIGTPRCREFATRRIAENRGYDSVYPPTRKAKQGQL